MRKYIIDPALPAPGDVKPLQPAAGISTTVQAPPAQLSGQEISNSVGSVLDGTHDGVSTAYDPNARKVNITNTDKGSVAVASHEAASDPHPQYETAAEVNSKIAAHSAATDPHGDRAYADSQDAAHVAAADPHPQYETAAEVAAQIATHAAATDPHGDRAYTDSQLSAHASANDPHTNLNASNLTSGTVPAARLSGSYNIDITGSAPWGGITGKPTTLSGYGITDAQPLASNLTAVADLASNGLIARTGSGAVAARSIAVSGTGLSVSNADGVSGNPTVTSNATSANTASTIVARDASGNFSAGTITASLTGAASLNVLKAGDTMTGSLTINEAAQQLVVKRTDSQYLVIENNHTTTAPQVTSYSAPGNAKRILFRATTDDANTTLTGGSLGFDFDTYNNTIFQINTSGINWNGSAAGNGSGITNLNASNLASGTVPAARLGSGSPSSARFLRGDGAWSNQIVGDYISVNRDNNSGFEIRTGNQATDEKSWFWISSGSQISLRAYNDTGNAEQPAMRFTRSGYTVTGWDFYVNNNSVISANSDRRVTIGAPASGSHTIGGDVAFLGIIGLKPAGVGGCSLVYGASNRSGYISFLSSSNVRQGYIGYSDTNNASDTGDIPYFAGSHTFTGQIRVASGSVSAPGLSFSGDTDTGLFRPAADIVALATNGVERFRIRANGTATFEQNLGLNTSSPTKALDINSDSFRLRTAKTPASATAAGETGEICWDANYLYICIATNTWRRIAHATW
jgi:hypothetical protein